jgi:hypothetical protein
MADQPRKTIRVTPRTPQPTTSPLKGQQVPGFGTVPFKPGVFMLPEEVESLKKIGWKEGDPIPADMAKILQKELKAVRKDIDESLPVAPDTPPLQLPKEVDIDSLPPERQAHLREFLAGFKKMQAAAARGETEALPSFVPMASDPSINKAMSAMAGMGKVAITDSGTKDKGTVIGGGGVGSPPPAPAATPPAASSPTGAMQQIEKCPHCSHRLADPVDLVPDQMDKMVFLQAITSGQRFKKAFSLFGGTVQITLKSLAINEIETCLAQVAYDQRDGKIVSYDQSTMALMDYRLSLSLDSIKVGDQFVELPETLDDWEVEEVKPGKGPLQTKIPKITEWLQTHTPLNRDFIWRAVGQMSLKFHKLANYMEARAPDADFWSATEDAI